ncbi:tannase/feruloyl esterase family alpha/beta hydrolase, partial [Acinetobacter baumannii]
QQRKADISTDAGQNATQNPIYPKAPQPTNNNGYAAITKHTPMAKKLIKPAYAKFPDSSNACSTSNSGRHDMNAATHFGDQ